MTTKADSYSIFPLRPKYRRIAEALPLRCSLQQAQQREIRKKRTLRDTAAAVLETLPVNTGITVCKMASHVIWHRLSPSVHSQIVSMVMTTDDGSDGWREEMKACSRAMTVGLRKDGRTTADMQVALFESILPFFSAVYHTHVVCSIATE